MTPEELTTAIGHAAVAAGVTVGVAESLTGGLLVQALARTEGSGDWLAGGVVSYATSVKRELLGVRAARVVSPDAVEEMARGAVARLGADVTVAVSGVAGPDEQDGEAPGTVWIGVASAEGQRSFRLQAHGSPEDVCEQTVTEALRHLLAAIETHGAATCGRSATPRWSAASQAAWTRPAP